MLVILSKILKRRGPKSPPVVSRHRRRTRARSFARTLALREDQSHPSRRRSRVSKLASNILAPRL